MKPQPLEERLKKGQGGEPGSGGGEQDLPREKKYYRELFAGFFAQMARWRGVLSEERFLVGKEEKSFLEGPGSLVEERAADVIFTPQGSLLVPSDETLSVKRKPDLIMRLGHQFYTLTDSQVMHTHFYASPGRRGQKEFTGRNGEPLNKIEIEVNQLDGAGMTQWLSVYNRINSTGTFQAEYEVCNGDFRRRGGMPDADAAHAFRVIDRLLTAPRKLPCS